LTIPEPNFLSRDAEQILLEVLSDFEALTGQPLRPHQPEWRVLQTFAHRETLVRIAIQLAAKANLVAFSEFPVIDYLGELVGAPRLTPQAAVTTLRFALPAPAVSDVPIPQDTRRSSQNDQAVFATGADAVIKAGESYVDVAATATATGSQANGYLAGQIDKEIDVLPDGVACVNTTTTTGGAAQETTDRYRARLVTAPIAASTAGSEEGYRFHSASASQAIEDVAVLYPGGKQVRIVLLDDDGSATELIPFVEAALNAEKVRPLTDELTVEASDVVTWELDAQLTLYKDADEGATLQAALDAAADYVQSRRRLGRMVDRGQVIAKLIVPGVHSCNLVEPASNVTPAADEWAKCTSASVVVTGFSGEIG
jgi:phage-related baseplate assembly protein